MPEVTLLQGLLAAGRPRKQYDREALGAFLQDGDQTEDSGEIIGILEQMQADMKEDLKSMQDTEAGAVAQFEALGSAKSKQITAANQAIQEMGIRLASSKVELVQTKADLGDTRERLQNDQDAFAKTKTACQKRDLDYGILKKEFATERVALADTIKILADDQAADTFKKTAVVSASFLQVGSSSRHRRRKDAIQMLQETSAQHPDQPALQLLAKQAAAAAKHGSKKGFAKILGLIDKMIVLLGKEGNTDKIKKANCDSELAANADEKAQLDNGIKTKTAEVANLEDKLSVTLKDMAKLDSDVQEMDKTVKDATTQRQKENGAYKEMLSDTNQAVGILDVAKKRLEEFYPKASLLQRAPTQSEEITSFLQEDESDNSGEDQASSSDEDNSVEKMSSGLKRKPQNSGAKVVLQMINTIQQDLKKEFASSKKVEDESQADYEDVLAEAKSKREVTARAMTEKEGVKAGLEEEAKKGHDRNEALQTQQAETIDILANLHKECDWLLDNFQERKKLRAAEIEALTRAKSTLSVA